MMDSAARRAAAEREYASLVLRIGQREVLPVRAIPYVTGWTISPDVVATSFARHPAGGFEKLRATTTYHQVDGHIVPLLPKEWDAVVAKLAGLEAELKALYSNDDRGYAAWLSSSASRLPSGVFVWRDEFEEDFRNCYQASRLSLVEERPGDRQLNMAPFLDNETLNMVLEGFGLGWRNPPLNHQSSDLVSSWIEQVLNDRFIDWDYWVARMPTLSGAEAARLMVGLDPDLYEDLNARPVPKNDCSRECAEAKRLERLASVEGNDRLPPLAWYEWALERSVKPHRGFTLAVRGRSLVEQMEEVLASLPVEEARRWSEAPESSPGKRQVSESYSGHVSTTVQTFPLFIVELEERLARWRSGRYQLIEAAQIIANQQPELDARLLVEQMEDAIRADELTFRVNGIKAAVRFIPKGHLWHKELFEQDVNAWLGAHAAAPELRLSYPYPEPVSRGIEKRGSSEVDDAALASRAQLIAAFGTFTGMDQTWFDKLSDTPALLRARKVKGQGQRGATVEPLFCPFEVMVWLISEKRRKGRALSENKGWELLERNFPRAYSKRSSADPRESTE